MVQAILAGRKTQTRRVIKPQPHDIDDRTSEEVNAAWQEGFIPEKCPYGAVGDVLYGRERFTDVNDHGCPAILYYADYETLDFMADEKYHCSDGSLNYEHPHIKKYHYSQWVGDVDSGEPHHGWKPSTHMPRWASRITLEITDIRVERLQDISEDDCAAEGVLECDGMFDHVEYAHYCNQMREVFGDLRPMYRQLWESIYGEGSWDENPWIWVIEFTPHLVNVDKYIAALGVK